MSTWSLYFVPRRNLSQMFKNIILVFSDYLSNQFEIKK